MEVRADRWTLPINLVRGTLDYALYFRPQHNSAQLRERLAPRCPRPVRAAHPLRAPAGAPVARDRFWRAARRAAARVPARPGDSPPGGGVRPRRGRRLPVRLHLLQRRRVPARRASARESPPSARWPAGTTSRPRARPTCCPTACWCGTRRWRARRRSSTRIARRAHRRHRRGQVRRLLRAGAHLAARGLRARAGIDPAHPYLLWVGSSPQIAGDESGFVRDLAATLRAAPATRELQVVVRPHPLNDCFAGFRGRGRGRVPAAPPRGPTWRARARTTSTPWPTAPRWPASTRRPSWRRRSPTAPA